MMPLRPSRSVLIRSIDGGKGVGYIRLFIFIYPAMVCLLRTPLVLRSRLSFGPE